MKSKLMMLIVVFSIILASNVNAGSHGRYFTGLWQGIDPNDGSESLRSIVKNDEGTFDIIGTESYFSACNGPSGVVIGTGELEDGDILCTITIECIGGPTFEDIEQRYVPDRLNKTLLEVSTSGYPTIILHRISR